MHRKRGATFRKSTKPKPFTAAFALRVREEWQYVQSTFNAQSNLIRSPVVLTCFVDMSTG